MTGEKRAGRGVARAAALAAMAAGCGGGGGGGVSQTDFGVTGELGAAAAYDQSAFGAGVEVAVLDDGVANPGGVFENRLVIEPSTPGGVGDDHGTNVASVIGARLGGPQPSHGVAPQATIRSVGGLTSPSRGSFASYLDAADGADVVNMSFGFVFSGGVRRSAGDPAPVSLATFQVAFDGADADTVYVVSAGNQGRDQVSAFAALPLYARDAAARLGLSRTDNPLLGSWLAVAALDETRTALASFSNACGDAAAFCLAARGVEVPAVDADGAAVTVAGTSFAAPQVAGAMALIKSLYPNLSNEAIADIILRSADDIGAPGVDPVFGHGRLNVARAAGPLGNLAPAGTVSFPEFDVNGDMTGTAVTPSAATGRALGAMFADGGDFAVVDAYGRGFTIDMAAFSREVRSRFGEEVLAWTNRRDVTIETAPGVEMRFAAADGAAPTAVRIQLSEHGWVGAAQGVGAADVAELAGLRAISDAEGAFALDGVGHPLLALIEAPMAAGAGTRAGAVRLSAVAATGEGAGGEPATAMAVTAAFGDAALGGAVTAGALWEESAFLGAHGDGPWAFGTGETLFASAAGRLRLAPGVALVGDVHGADVRIGAGPGLIEGGQAQAFGWAAGLELRGAVAPSDVLRATVGQPFAVRSGVLGYRVGDPAGLRAAEGGLDADPPLDATLAWRVTGPRSSVAAIGFASLDGSGAGAAVRVARDF